MNPENTSKLLTAYPLLYRELREQCFECGDGWFDLVWQVSAEIETAAQLEGIPKAAEAWPSVGILKQKFGALRVQFRTRVNEAIEAVAANAYERSKETCELCGAPAQHDRERELGRWEEALCESCRKAHRPPPRDQDKRSCRPGRWNETVSCEQHTNFSLFGSGATSDVGAIDRGICRTRQNLLNENYVQEIIEILKNHVLVLS